MNAEVDLEEIQGFSARVQAADGAAVHVTVGDHAEARKLLGRSSSATRRTRRRIHDCPTDWHVGSSRRLAMIRQLRVERHLLLPQLGMTGRAGRLEIRDRAPRCREVIRAAFVGGAPNVAKLCAIYRRERPQNWIGV